MMTVPLIVHGLLAVAPLGAITFSMRRGRIVYAAVPYARYEDKPPTR